MVDFQTHLDLFKEENIGLVAASIDPLDKAKETIEKNKLTFPVGYGLDAEEISRKTGAFYDKKKKFLHATGFLLDPDKKVFVAVYSTGPIGRFTAWDVLNLVKFIKSGRKKSFEMKKGRLFVK